MIDIASRKTIDSFKLSSGNKHVRVNNLQPDPGNKYLILMYRTATKLIDRWEIGPPTLQQYDLTTHQFTRVIPWPGGDERESVNMRLGPDGKHLFIFGDEVTVLETTNFTEVESWPFSGADRARAGPDQSRAVARFLRSAGQLHRALHDAGRRAEAPADGHRPGRPGEPEGRLPADRTGDAGVPFAKSPDGKRGYGLVQEIGRYEMWTFDLEKPAVLKRTEFEGRPRMAVRVSSNGKLVYVYVAGATVDIWDAATHKYLRTMALGGDQTTELFVVPGPAPATTSASR